MRSSHRIYHRLPLLIERHAQRVQSQIVDIGPPPYPPPGTAIGSRNEPGPHLSRGIRAAGFLQTPAEAPRCSRFRPPISGRNAATNLGVIMPANPSIAVKSRHFEPQPGQAPVPVSTLIRAHADHGGCGAADLAVRTGCSVVQDAFCRRSRHEPLHYGRLSRRPQDDRACLGSQSAISRPVARGPNSRGARPKRAFAEAFPAPLPAPSRKPSRIPAHPRQHRGNDPRADSPHSKSPNSPKLARPHERRFARLNPVPWIRMAADAAQVAAPVTNRSPAGNRRCSGRTSAQGRRTALPAPTDDWLSYFHCGYFVRSASALRSLLGAGRMLGRV